MKKFLYALLMCASTTVAVAQTSNRPDVLSSANGRFVFGQISEFNRDKFMLDTQTGRLWQLVQDGPRNADGSVDKAKAYNVLDPVPYTEIGGKISLTPPQK